MPKPPASRTPAPAKPAPKELVVTSDIMNELSALAGQGMENVTAKDVLVPRIGILQALSPQLIKTKPEFIEGAKVGDICDLGTGEILPNPLIFIPCYYVMQWLEWAPRNTNKGLVNVHTTDEILNETKPDEKGRNVMPNGNYIAETAQFFGLNVSADFRRSFIPMTSTQLKKARRWLTLATSEKIEGPNGPFTPPLFYRMYQLSTVTESNAEGTWDGWKTERFEPITTLANARQIMDDCKAFRQMLADSKARADLTSMSDDPAPHADGGRM